MSDLPVSTAAEIRAAAARDRLTRTLSKLQSRLSPKSLAQDAVQGLIGKGQKSVQSGIDVAKRHPLPLTGALAALGLFFARKPIARLLTCRKTDATDLPAASLTTSRAAKRKPR